MEQTVNFTPCQVRVLFENLREKIRRETSPEAGTSAARQLELPGFSLAPSAWDPAQALGGLITRNAAARRMERRPA